MEVILDYKGPVDFEKAESLISKLKQTTAFKTIRKPIRKKVYSIFIECLENIYKYSAPELRDKDFPLDLPCINLCKQAGKFIIRTGNTIHNNRIKELSAKLDDIHRKDMEGLRRTYAEIIDDESNLAVNGAGLGLVIIGLRSENNFEYSFREINKQYSYFEMEINISD